MPHAILDIIQLKLRQYLRETYFISIIFNIELNKPKLIKISIHSSDANTNVPIARVDGITTPSFECSKQSINSRKSPFWAIFSPIECISIF